ncbi:MAG: reverse transcriptase family protein [Coprobacillus sp.]
MQTERIKLNEEYKTKTKTVKIENKFKNNNYIGTHKENIKQTNDNQMTATNSFYYDVKAKLMANIQLTNNQHIKERKQIYKIPQIKLKHAYVVTIDNIIKDTIKGKTLTLDEIINITYSAQLTYQNLTDKKRTTHDAMNKMRNQIENWEKELDVTEKRFNKNIILTQEERIKLALTLTRMDRKTPKLFIERLKQKILTTKSRIKSITLKKEKRRANYMFELNRAGFYRKLNDEKYHHLKSDNYKEYTEYWQGIYTKDYNNEVNEVKTSEYQEQFDEVKLHENIVKELKDAEEDYVISIDDFVLLLRKLPNWKAAGIDRVYNYWIKNLTSLHNQLYHSIFKLIDNSSQMPHYLYESLTYLIPKNENENAQNTRPISCLSAYYKLITKILTNYIYKINEKYNTITDNQLGCKRETRGASEQFMYNQMITEQHPNVKVAYIDVKKAYDSINHDILFEILDSSRYNKKCIKFIKHSIKKTKINLIMNKQIISTISPTNGILQGDSLSPILFILYMNEFSKKMNQNTIKLSLSSKNNFKYELNHLLFIDDIKIYANTNDNLKELVKTATAYLKNIKLEVNCHKTKASINIDDIQIIPTEGYKYLGVIETNYSRLNKTNHNNIKEKIISRFNKITQTNLNANNMTKAYNEYVVSLINYYTGIIEFNNSTLSTIDKEIRSIMIRNKFNSFNNSTNRLYVKRRNGGRGYLNFNTMYENNVISLYLYSKTRNTIRKALIHDKITSTKSINNIILQYEKYKNDNLKINKTIKINEGEPTTQKEFITYKKQIQKDQILEIEMKQIHGIYFRNLKLEHVSLKDSLMIINKGSLSMKEESIVFNLQDRNLYNLRTRECRYCGKSNASVDHIATRCNKLNHTRYIERHNAIVKIIHKALIKKHNINNIEYHHSSNIAKVVQNNSIKIISDMPIETAYKVQFNKPDIVIINNDNKTIQIIDITVTNTERIKISELEKIQKYDELSKDMMQTYSMKVIIIPFAISWDGAVSKMNVKHRQKIGIDNNTFIRIQKTAIIMTFTIVYGLKGYIDNWCNDEPGNRKNEDIVKNETNFIDKELTHSETNEIVYKKEQHKKYRNNDKDDENGCGGMVECVKKVKRY